MDYQTANGLLIKRSGKADTGHWQIVSDNPAWEPAPWPTHAEVIGQVRWMARSLG